MGKLKDLFHPKSGEKLHKHSRPTSSHAPAADPQQSQTRVLSALVKPDHQETGEAYTAPTTEALDSSWTSVPFTKRSSLPASGQDESRLVDVQRDLQSLDLNRLSVEQQERTSISAASDKSNSVYHDITANRGRATDDVSPVQHDRSEPVLGREMPLHDHNRRTSIGRKPVSEAIADGEHTHARRFSINRKPVGERATQSDQSQHTGSHTNFNQANSAQQEALKGVVDLTNTTDTSIHQTTAPAVTQETIHPHVHHVREEVIHREIHTHDVFHRIQPIIDVRVLPARHFVPGPSGDLVEIPADSVPGRKGNWAVVQAPRPQEVSEVERPRLEEDFETVDEDGVKRSRTTHRHEPVLEDGGRLTGQTQEIHV